ncbi:MAG: glycosyltransferase family 2 protein [Planctomycetota bacterium]|jgi:hypothetical protein
MSLRYSIVIPTRDRPALVPIAVANALDQDHDDFEVVVSDNSRGELTDRALARFNDPRLRIVSTGGDLLMHESWAFAVQQARGEYVIVLCDDDVHCPRLLRVLDDVRRDEPADVYYWSRAGFMVRGSRPMAEAAHVEFRTLYADRVYEVDAARLIDACFDMRVTHNDLIPRMLNTAVRRELLARAAAAGSLFFRPSCPDYSAMLAMALHADRLLLLDAPLSITGLTPLSTGWTAARQAEVDPGFVNGLLRRVPDMVRPPGLMTTCCWIAQTYMQCARDDPALAGRSVNLVHVYGIAGLEIEQWRRRGFDVTRPEQELRRVLDEMGDDERAAVRDFIARGRSVETDRFLDARPIGRSVLGGGPRLVPGADFQEAGPETILAFAAALDAWLTDHGRSVASVWDELELRAAGRTCVIYGLGNGGRMLCRHLPGPGHPLTGRVACVDDGQDESPPSPPRLASSGQLDPDRHLVLVTPIDAAGIETRLQGSGFARGSSYLTVSDIVPARTVEGAGAPAAGPAGLSGSRSAG